MVFGPQQGEKTSDLYLGSRTPQKSDPGGLENIQNSSVKIEHWNFSSTEQRTMASGQL